MRKTWIVAVLVVAAFGIVWAVPDYRIKVQDGFARLVERGKAATAPASRGRGDKRGGPGAGGISVETALAEASTATEDISAIGSLRSDESVDIASEIAGRISEMPFKEGQPVKEGAVLVRLDDALVRAELADAEARFKLADSNSGRARALSRTGNVTEKAQDEAVANLETARAAVELARVRLDKHVIGAPFAGTAGIRKVSPGAFVGAGTVIVNLEKIDPLKVDFKVPEVFLSSVTVGQSIEVLVDALPGRTFKGEIYAIDPMVDVNGRALTVRARLPNGDRTLRPGLFARILIKGKTEREIVTVPESAIVPRGGETFVYRVDNGRAIETAVKLGERRDGRVEIVEGLMATAHVVTAGQQKLKDGAAVEAIAAGERPVARRKG